MRTADISDLEGRHQHRAITKAECRIKNDVLAYTDHNTYCDQIKRNLVTNPPKILNYLPHLIQQTEVNKHA